MLATMVVGFGVLSLLLDCSFNIGIGCCKSHCAWSRTWYVILFWKVISEMSPSSAAVVCVNFWGHWMERVPPRGQPRSITIAGCPSHFQFSLSENRGIRVCIFADFFQVMSQREKVAVQYKGMLLFTDGFVAALDPIWAVMSASCSWRAGARTKLANWFWKVGLNGEPSLP